MALDIGFWGNYINNSKVHFVLGIRHSSHIYTNPGDNRCGAAILGEFGPRRAAALEEVEISNQFLNKIYLETPNIVQEGRRYRLAIESIAIDGKVIHDIRLKDHTTGALVYAPTPFESEFPNNHNLNARGIVLATVATGVFAPYCGGSYSNLCSYWTHATDWVQNP